MEIKWTKEQEESIFDRNHNLLVSASAGSGKTTVMIERIFRLIHDEHIPITNFLIVTFTKASASDMKKKLTEKLEEFADDEFIASQIENMASSDISNLHSFCSRLITTYFYEVNIDPAYKIIDEGEGTFLKERALKLLFEEKENSGDEEFFTLFEIFQKKRSNKNLKDVIIRFNNFLNTNLDSEKFIGEMIEKSYCEDLTQNQCAKIINSYVPSAMKEDAERVEEFATKCREEGADKLSEHFFEIADKLKTVKFSNSYMANAKNVFEISLDKSPAAPKDKKYLGEEAKAIKKAIGDNLKSYKKNYVSDDEEFLKKGLSVSKDYLKYLYKLTNEFNEKYTKLKLDANGLDFNDLEKYALKILSNSEINQAVKEKYKYVFVDEYQDINSVQEKIISLVSGKNNRFMVGDVKQSIYRFRLCNPDIFLAKFEEYKNNTGDNRLVKLNCNFRSDKKILKYVDSVFCERMTENFGGLDYAKDSQFVPGENNADGEKSVNLIFCDTESEALEEKVASGVYSVKNHVNTETDEQKKAVLEATIVKDKILELISPENPKHMKFSDIAILISTRNAMTTKFAETLSEFGIPVSADNKKDLMQSVAVKELVNFAKFLCNPNDDFVAFKTLKSRLFNFSDNELAETRKIDLKCRFYECINRYEELENEELKNKLAESLSLAEKFRKFAKILKVKDLFKKIVDEFSLENINLLEEDGEILNDDISLFINSLPSVSLFEYVRNFADGTLEVEGESGGDSVKIMTIHKSKGIEFKAVFLINLSNNFNFQSTYGSILMNTNLGVGLDYFDLDSRSEKPTVAISAIRIVEKRKLVEEQQRVLYVGLTRAKEKLFIICSKPKKNLSENFGARHKAFIEWFERDILNEENGKHNALINYESYLASELAGESKSDKKELLLTKREAKEPEWYHYDYESEANIPAKSSISKLIKLQEEREEELDENDDRVIFEKNSSSAKRGTIYHKVFEKIDLKNLDSAPAQLNEILEENFDEDERKIVDKNLVLEVLCLEIFKEIKSGDKIIKEREFFASVPASIATSQNSNESIIIQGVIDLAIIRDEGIILVDYKTGKMNEEKLNKYKFQMDVYSYAIEKAMGKKVLKRVLVLIDEKNMQEI